MTIKDKYYNDRIVDYNGNDLTINAGNFNVGGNLIVSGTISGSEDSGVNLNTNDDLYITGNADWYFNNDDHSILIFNDLYKKYAIGHNVSENSFRFDESFQNNPNFYFSAESNFLGSGSSYNGSAFVAEFHNFNDHSSASVMRLSVNKPRDGMSSSTKFLEFVGNDGTNLSSCGYISGLAQDGLFGREGGMLLHSAKDVKVSSLGTLCLSADDVIFSDKGTLSSLEVEKMESIGPGRWFFPKTRTLHFYENNRYFDGHKSYTIDNDEEYPGDEDVTRSDIRYLTTRIPIPLGPDDARIISVSVMWGQGSNENLVGNPGRGIGETEWFGASPPLGTTPGYGVGWKVRSTGGSDSTHELEIWLSTSILFSDFDFITHVQGGNKFPKVRLDFMATITYREI